jgi:hypothetical protein
VFKTAHYTATGGMEIDGILARSQASLSQPKTTGDP